MVVAKTGIIRHGFVGFAAVFVDVCDILITARKPDPAKGAGT